MEALTWKTEKRFVRDLIPSEINPRKITTEQETALTKSLQKFNLAEIPVLNKDNSIISGNQRTRILAALGRGDEKIDVRVPNRMLDQTELKEYMLIANTHAGEFDELLLELHFNDIEIEFQIPIFDQTHTVKEHERNNGKTDEDQVPEPATVAISKVGDVWKLGKHRVMCGDSTSELDVAAMMKGNTAELVFTDPPYRMDATGGSAQPIGRAAAKLGETIKHLCDFKPEAFLSVLKTIFNKGTMNAYVFCNKDLIPDYLNWAIANNYSFNVLFWKKPNAIPLGGQHRPDTEYIIFFRKNATWNNALEGVNYSKCLEFSRENSTPHPTMKPVALIENELYISSSLGGIVVDLFGGSGSTLIAGEKAERIVFLMETDPIFVDVIVKRWQAFTGEKAVNEATGKFFD